MPHTPLLQPDIQRFIKEHENDDVRALALKKPPHADWPYPLIIDQIKARQKAKTKLPEWLQRSGVIFPPGDIMEQASSSATAKYKASLVEGEIFADLTGGAGVDTWAISAAFDRGICIDQNEHAAALIEHNMIIMSDTEMTVHTASAEEFIKDMPEVDLIYLDPQRRNENRKGLYALSDCAPDVTALLPALSDKARCAIIKTSPMLDITQAIHDLKHVCAVHIVQWRGECKEVLYFLDFDETMPAEDIPHICVLLDDDGQPEKSFGFTRRDEKTEAPTTAPQKYLYEPDPALQKAGAFNALAAAFNISKLHKHTHLYTADELHTDFPGRYFEIIDLLPVNRKGLSFDKANLTIRNFPGDVAALRKKLKLKDGGNEYLFACTLHDEQKILVHARKTNM